jgi:YbbR domain-containing protein
MFHTKQVPLELKVTGTPDDKYGDADIAIPKEVVVKGSAYTLERVTSISADSIDISDVKKNCTVKVVPHLPGGVELAEESKNIGVKIEFK